MCPSRVQRFHREFPFQSVQPVHPEIHWSWFRHRIQRTPSSTEGGWRPLQICWPSPDALAWPEVSLTFSGWVKHLGGLGFGDAGGINEQQRIWWWIGCAVWYHIVSYHISYHIIWCNLMHHDVNISSFEDVFHAQSASSSKTWFERWLVHSCAVAHVNRQGGMTRDSVISTDLCCQLMFESSSCILDGSVASNLKHLQQAYRHAAYILYSSYGKNNVVSLDRGTRHKHATSKT